MMMHEKPSRYPARKPGQYAVWWERQEENMGEFFLVTTTPTKIITFSRCRLLLANRLNLLPDSRNHYFSIPDIRTK
jgi:hypothetical protein